MFHFMLFDGKIDSHALYEITITNQETFKDHNKGLGLNFIHHWSNKDCKTCKNHNLKPQYHT